MREHRIRTALAFAAIYLVWGSTFLAIRYAIATIPPHVMATTRYASAGAILVAVARGRGAAWPTRAEWGVAVVSGLLLLALGNGTVSWAELRVPSGLTALSLAAVPLVTVLADRIGPAAPRNAAPGAVTWLGLAVGLVGVGLLVNPRARDAAHVDPEGAAALAFATCSWAAGTVYSRRVRGTGSPLMGAGASMLMGSAGLLVLAAALGQLNGFDPRLVSMRSLLALGYLSVFGAVLAFTAYFWLVRHVSAAAVTTYAYVNPVVALLLGSAVGGEPLTARVAVSAALIVAGVLLVTGLPGLASPLRRTG